MHGENPYESYAENNIFGSNPLGLVTALYEGAINAVEQARICLANERIMERSRWISKALNILVELSVSLDTDNKTDLTRRLAELYDYMQRRVLEAHSRQMDAPLAEVTSLLSTLLEGWQGAAVKNIANEVNGLKAQRMQPTPDAEEFSVAYGYGQDFGVAVEAGAFC